MAEILRCEHHWLPNFAKIRLEFTMTLTNKQANQQTHMITIAPGRHNNNVNDHKVNLRVNSVTGLYYYDIKITGCCIVDPRTVVVCRCRHR